MLVELLLLARLPLLERLLGFERLTRWHAWNGRVGLTLLVSHAVLVTAGYTIGDRISLPSEIGRLWSGYPGVITATAGLVILIGVVVTSVVAVRRRLRYETWYFVHLYAYLGVALAFSHQLATGTDFVGDPAARAYWTALYVVTLGALVVFRLGVPLARSALARAARRARASRRRRASPRSRSRAAGSSGCDARAGQFFTWRFLTRDRWWEAHPFSLSAAPDGRRLRITVKGLGDYTSGAARDPARHARDRRGAVRRLHHRRAAAPAGRADRRRRRDHADPRAARGHARRAGRHRRRLPRAGRGRRDPARRARRAGAPARRGGALRDRRPRGRATLLSPERLLALVPDIAARDVYVCGPPAMTEATRASLARTGVSRRHIVTERFAF